MKRGSWYKEETRWYRCTMDSGPFSVGDNEYNLMRDVRDCCRRAEDFTITWHDTADEAYAGCVGEVILDEQARCIGWRSQAEVNEIIRTREAERNRP